MITADQLDRVCVVAYHVIQGNDHLLSSEDWDLLDEMGTHAEDVLAQQNENENVESESDSRNWDDDFDEDYGYSYDPYDHDPL